MAARRRLDVEMVRRHLAESREGAQRLILSGVVTVDGMRADKPARQVTDSASITVASDDGDDFASRGAHKLIGALRDFRSRGLATVTDRDCLDAGASTGGFTDVLLREGARTVVAVDVGYGQMIWRLQSDPRVTVIDRTNARHLTPTDIPTTPSLVVADLSFISLRLVLPALAAVCADSGDLVVMVKPQFEVGRQRVGKNGVVADPAARIDAVWGVIESATGLGWMARAVTRSQLPGPAGNVEYFVWLRRDGVSMDRTAVEAEMAEATTL